MEVKELMFWFCLLPLMGILSILMGGERQHSWRTWREEEVRWSCGLDLSRSLPLAVSARCGEKHVPLTVVV